MQKLFFGIYGAILASTLLLLSLTWFALTSYNQYRYQSHLEAVMQGTSYLISRGVNRQAPEDQPRWVELAASLLDARLQVASVVESQQSQYKIIKATAQQNSTDKYQITFQQANSKRRIELEFEGVTEPILTATAFFLLNELGRTPPQERQQLFHQLQAQFNYDLFRIPQNQLGLDSRQLASLQRGETVVTVQRQFGQELAFNVYAPWGKTTDALVLGPVAFFDPFPAYIAASILGCALVFMAVLVMLLIRKLGKRLMALQYKVDAIGAKHHSSEPEEKNAEIITGLSNKIHNMSQRIDNLLAEKAHMIRAISHDLRTPIAKIHFRVEALDARLPAPDNGIVDIKNDLRQLNTLIDELLTYEQLTETQAIEFKTIQLLPLVQQQIEGMKLIYGQRNFNLSLEEDTTIEANEVLLKRLLENLLSNAARFARTQVSVHTIEVSENVVIVINDDGPGLGDIDTRQLFDPFFKADASRTRGKGGYGLGLAIVKQITMQHSGTIEASNNDKGGARFKLTLPLRQTSE